jgi:hypothetical protein
MDIDLTKIYEFADRRGNQTILNPNETDIYTCAHRLANFLIQEQDDYSFRWTPTGTWIDSIANHPEPKIRKRMKIWLQQGKIGFRGRVKYLFWLANNDKYQSRNFIMHLLSIDQPKPDLEYLLSNLTQIGYGVNKAINWSNFKAKPDIFENPTTRAIDKLVSSEEEYLRVLSLPEIDIPRMGGWRNTVIGWHERDLEDIEIFDDSDIYFDLGGGHHTPWYNNRFEKSFISLDIDPPWPVNSVALRYLDTDESDEPKLKIMKDHKLESYEKKLQEQLWSRWDLYNDSLPIGDANKITVFSSGFLTSTLTPPKEHVEILTQSPNPKKAVHKFKLMMKFQCMMGLVKILEPVYQGKTVELVTLSRPSKFITKHRLCHIRWEDQEIVYFDVKEHGRRFTDPNFKHKRSSELQVNIQNQGETPNDL